MNDIDIVAATIGFYISMIKSGKSWTEECEKERAKALEALQRLAKK